MNKEKLCVYQMALRTFTPEGTLNAAKKLLSHVASLGVDVLYVCPFYMAENDMDPDTWSPRQKASQTNNPKNPYKMADYFNVDPEYGTNEDLKAFVQEAHRNGLLVMFDLVYLHCGRGAVFLKEHPDFIERNDDGSDVVGDRWPFARLNYASAGLRAYLKENVEYLISEFGADGYRCDVGDSVPLDFWEEAFLPIKERDPSFVTLNEGRAPEYLEKVFDWGYSFEWASTMRKIFSGLLPATALRERYEEEKVLYGKNMNRLVRAIDNHDTVSDAGLNRIELTMTGRGVEAALAVAYTYDGIPFLWNGIEHCDSGENNMFSNREYGRRSAMDWSKGFTAEGKHRRDVIRQLHSIHKKLDGDLEWIENTAPNAVISYAKKWMGKDVVIAVNSQNHAVEDALAVDAAEILLQSGATVENGKLQLAPYGYMIAKKG